MNTLLRMNGSELPDTTAVVSFAFSAIESDHHRHKLLALGHHGIWYLACLTLLSAVQHRADELVRAVVLNRQGSNDSNIS